MMHQISQVSSTALDHHADPLGVYQSHRVGMMHECRTRIELTLCVHLGFRKGRWHTFGEKSELYCLIDKRSLHTEGGI